MAIQTVRGNKLRSALTILGVVIGITSIVGMTSLIRGFDESLRDQVRTLGPGTTEQITVVIEPPPTAATASCRFRLNCTSTNSPEEDFTEGPLVNLRITARPLNGERRFPWIWLLVVLGVLAVAAPIAYLLLRPSGNVVPRVVGQPFEAARSQLQALGVTVQRVDKPITDDCPGNVIATAPPPGQPMPKGSAISVTVGALASGPDTCKSGFVWREAFPGDHICVTPAVRAQTNIENQQAPSRRMPLGLPFGGPPDLCAQGFVWREARQGDRVCVPGASRDQAADDNRQAASRRSCQR